MAARFSGSAARLSTKLCWIARDREPPGLRSSRHKGHSFRSNYVAISIPWPYQVRSPLYRQRLSRHREFDDNVDSAAQHQHEIALHMNTVTSALLFLVKFRRCQGQLLSAT